MMDMSAMHGFPRGAGAEEQFPASNAGMDAVYSYLMDGGANASGMTMPACPPDPTLPATPAAMQLPVRDKPACDAFLQLSSLSSSSPPPPPPPPPLLPPPSPRLHPPLPLLAETAATAAPLSPPTDPNDWRARLRYCEQHPRKAALDASLVRLLDLSEGLSDDELAARRRANLRFDRVREQRLKDRNNEAAKRSRQRKVQRIEAAEQQIAAALRSREALRLERDALAAELAGTQAELAATRRQVAMLLREEEAVVDDDGDDDDDDDDDEMMDKAEHETEMAALE